MIYLAWVVFGFTFFQLCIAGLNYFFREKIPISTNRISDEKISVLIPARNEEQHIGNLLNDLSGEDDNILEIIVFDDLSSDHTVEIVNQFIGTNEKIRLIRSTHLPAGWLGKNFACYSLANAAKGNYFLFLDADVRMEKEIVVSSVKFFKQKSLHLLSIFPTQLMMTKGEKMTVPNMNYILLTLLLLPLVRKLSFPSISAANGQFMLFDADTYKKFQPHEKFKDKRVEDIEIARFYKKLKLKIACLTGIKQVRCRMYENFAEAVNGFSKNVIHFFGNSFLIAVLFWIVTTFGWLAVWLAFGLPTLAVYLLAVVCIRIFFSLASNQSILDNLIFFIPQQFSLGIFIYQALINRSKNQYLWKGRKV
ncbi:MAG TPA: glycosyltransferase family 2 protein [Paludibacteraceae bacterium]|jgi:glycosyltransferase involved in cell wall biosynthesis|nr:glycosyltransferase family 2 protein [Paludibacteraceae bacterium]OPZ02662.1 MAG: 4,4'-diaponeurosporenoate glycosyltransferase [Bacteroidetes bacterium ADurb.BinA395]MBP8966755.1 glycosyltransferase family 2 protein [Paludibacteraceae bacterium]HOF98763.1 glycosyltransferase family 2 protein [Paludibacteraceae bacterium]HON02459.1 glycosyltransferase family 2 protein [Paludibacteraceae bacterium]